jgi:hypothetical protein
MEDRINGCFRRSLNGMPLANDSKEMRAMVAFMEWMRAGAKQGDKIEGRGFRKVDRNIKPDPVRGERLYKAGCAVCHGESGGGMKKAEGEWIFPLLWGDASFNIRRKYGPDLYRGWLREKQHAHCPCAEFPARPGRVAGSGCRRYRRIFYAYATAGFSG